LVDSNNGVDPVQANFEFIYQQPAVASVIVGTITPAHLRDNVQKVIRALA
jgi:aryl-alcohol dehydrogenase-like predicted oxidoreductase